MKSEIKSQSSSLSAVGQKSIRFNFHESFQFILIIVNEFNQPYLLEYNTRFGDPEIQSISLRVKSDFLCHADSE